MADSVWGQRFSDEQFVQLLRVDAHKIRQRATERLQKAGGSLNWMLRARKSLGLAVGRLEALELEYDPEAEEAELEAKRHGHRRKKDAPRVDDDVEKAQTAYGT